MTFTSNAGWLTSFDADRQLSFAAPAYVPIGAVATGDVVTGETFNHRHRSATPGTTTCCHLEIYGGVTLLAAHGSAVSPASCNSASEYKLDSFSLPEIDSAARANSVVVRLYLRNSGGGRSQHDPATLGLTYYLP